MSLHCEKSVPIRIWQNCTSETRTYLSNQCTMKDGHRMEWEYTTYHNNWYSFIINITYYLAYLSTFGLADNIVGLTSCYLLLLWLNNLLITWHRFILVFQCCNLLDLCPPPPIFALQPIYLALPLTYTRYFYLLVFVMQSHILGVTTNFFCMLPATSICYHPPLLRATILIVCVLSPTSFACYHPHLLRPPTHIFCVLLPTFSVLSLTCYGL